MTTQNLLVELFVEELPPKALNKLGSAFASVLAEQLKAQGLAAADAVVTAFASPRRLAVHVSGVVGKAATEYFAALPDWQVLALSRRPFDLPEGVQHVPVDLCDAQACQSAAANLGHVTHVLFAALFELPELVTFVPGKDFSD